MAYVDGFVLPVLKDKVALYKEKSRDMGEIYKSHGALSYVECIADDVPYGELTSFPRAVQATPDEVVVFSWVSYESRQQRDAINGKVMADPRMKAMFADLPVDGKRMIFGGFDALVQM
jgi:uncharacterized protein YbaA (DUF1428 family)